MSLCGGTQRVSSLFANGEHMGTDTTDDNL